MDCVRTLELLNPLIDRELPLDLSSAVLSHLDACASCRLASDGLRRTSRIVAGLATKAPVGLGARILSEARLQAAPVREPLMPLWSKVAAVLLGAASVTFAFWSAPGPILRGPTLESVRARSAVHRLVFESQADLELGGSFHRDLRYLVGTPEGRLIYGLTGGR